MLIPFKINRPILLLSEHQKRREGDLETASPKQFEAATNLKEGSYSIAAGIDILHPEYFSYESEKIRENELLFVK
jgi:hypothetical protein